MKLSEATELILDPDVVSSGKKLWADLGCGSGLFSQALALLIAPGSKIFAVDSNKAALNRIEPSKRVTIEKMNADFAKDTLQLSGLDGILMANSLHFIQDKLQFIKRIDRLLSGEGSFLIVEYDTDEPNPWVPYPLSFRELGPLFRKVGYQVVRQINELPSRYDHATIYSALVKKEA
jgi:ubiquinone/menaquinone biosynthesis C-methylase UbiE